MENDINYFHSYEDLEVHNLMLKDSIRTLAYKEAITENPEFFANKTVMDVGCGTGILSVFAAQAGAKKVYAIEASNLADLAKEVVKENNFENIIEVFQCRVEDFSMPNEDEKVDVIVSEWMGFYLLHEGMLDTVIFARDNFLKPDGKIFPSTAVIFVGPCSLPEPYDSKWKDMYGVKMSSFGKHYRKSKCIKPEITVIKPEDMIGPEIPVCWIDLMEAKHEDLDSFSITHVVAARKNANFQGVCLWFEVVFPNVSERPEVILETSPYTATTHWKQTALVLPEDQEVEEGEPLAFQLDLSRHRPNCRRYNIVLTMLDPESIEHPLPCACYMTRCIVARTFLDNVPRVNGIPTTEPNPTIENQNNNV